jgi:hypothetical protein
VVVGEVDFAVGCVTLSTAAQPNRKTPAEKGIRIFAMKLFEKRFIIIPPFRTIQSGIALFLPCSLKLIPYP